MNPNGKWSFLVPITLAAATLMGATPARAEQSRDATAQAPETAKPAPAADALVLQPGAGQPEMKDHSSHSSHSSHASHRSHYSSR
jgi:hypothetical protein